MASSTRLKSDVYLVGACDLEPLSRLKQLPTIQQVLQRFHQHLDDSRSVRNASHLTVEEVSLVWSKSAIPMTLKRNAIDKLEKLHDSWLLLKKNKKRDSETQRQKEAAYSTQISTLFDIAHVDALSLIKIAEDRDFLVDQRGARKMYIAAEDKELADKQERVRQRKRQQEERRQRAINAAMPSASQILDVHLMTDGTESSEFSSNSDEDFDPAVLKTPSPSLPSRTRIAEKQFTPISQLFTPHVTSALDRNKTSDREAVRLMVPIVAALGCDPSALPLSRSTIHRVRKKARKEHAEATRSEFLPEYPLVVHWDGKILPEIFGAGDVDRLPVLVSGDGEEKLLGVPKLAAGTGLNESMAVYNLLELWKLTDKVQAMSFDTTSVNTGRFNGVCVLLEAKIGRELLWLACRHHVYELILAKVFTLCCGPSNSPYIPIFQRFKAAWGGVTLDHFQELEMEAGTEVFREPALSFLTEFVEAKSHSELRDDYQELIELTMIVLGSQPTKIHWRAPGPIHHARWMAKLQYAIKIFLFRDQRDVFNLTKKEEKQIRRFVQFGALLYTKAWTKAPLAAEAPGQDLSLWIDLVKYESVDREISIAARKVLESHLWYLSDEAVGLALFSDQLPAADKVKIVDRMSAEPGERKVRGDATLLKDGACLGDFANRRTRSLLLRLKIGDSFLTLPPEKWIENEDYKKGRERIWQLRVVNDTAERGVKLFEEFNRLITNDEEEKQFLLQVVEANRKAVPTQTTKKSAIEALSRV